MPRALVIAALLLAAGFPCSLASAAPPWAKLVPFRKVEADPNESYELTESNGPWMIMCASFAGPNAEKQAHELVLELRGKYKLEAYLFQQHYDFTNSELGNTLDKYGRRKRVKNLRAVKFNELAVLVGNFHSVDQPNVESTLKSIKTMRPAALDTKNGTTETNQQLANLRDAVRWATGDPRTRAKGPMGNAFVTKNPLLPDEFFTSKGLDPFVVELNEDLPFSLLKNPGTYTVKVASFRGAESIEYERDEIAKFENMLGKPRQGSRSNLAKIDEAALKATKLTKALREQGVEAYEFHDRTESIVCIGSFDSVGTPRADGKTEINPAIHRLMQQYGPETIQDPKLGPGQLGVRPRSLAGIPFDVQPLPVMVPKESIAARFRDREG
ncbi:MAG TPA: hypothetical protein VMP01_23655 [Pirellulaceae bacterium]|nr:hypothetical protein [Pirellulaceae bacterium]